MVRAKGTTTDEVLSVNGVVLNTLAKNIESLTGRLTTPAKRTSNVVVPGRHGAVRTRGKKYDQNVIVLPMWVVGSNDDGSIPKTTNERTLFFQNVDALTWLFAGGDAELDIRHTLPDGSIRQAFGDVLDTLDFSTSGHNPIGKFSVSITMSDPFWRDLNPVTATKVANGATITLPEFTGATAPMEDLVVQLVGPWNNPKLTFSDGSWVQYSDTFAAGKGVILDSGTWSLTGVGGYVPSLQKLTYGGTSSRWVALPAAGMGIPSVTLTGGAERTAATQVIVTGRRKYLVG